MRQRRAGDACPELRCGHERCWIEEAHVTELTGLLREGPGRDQLAGWPAHMRVFARRKRAHPGAQLSLFEIADGWRYSLWVTNLPASLRGWRANPAYIDAAHRVHARVEDGIRTGKDCGIGHFPTADLDRPTRLLSVEDSDAMRQVYRLLADSAVQGNRALQTALRRLVLAGSRNLVEDRLVDLMTGAEALFIKHRGIKSREKSRHIAEGASILLSGDRVLGADSGAITEFMRLAYRLRNDESHHFGINSAWLANPRGRGTPGHPARQPGNCHTRTLQSRSLTRLSARSRPTINQRE